MALPEGDGDVDGMAERTALDGPSVCVSVVVCWCVGRNPNQPAN